MVFLGLSGRSQLFLCLEVCLAGFLVLNVESSLGDYLQRQLDMTQELFWTSLIEDHDGRCHFLRDFDLVVAVFGCVHDSRDIGDDWFIQPGAPCTLLRPETFCDG